MNSMKPPVYITIIGMKETKTVFSHQMSYKILYKIVTSMTRNTIQAYSFQYRKIVAITHAFIFLELTEVLLPILVTLGFPIGFLRLGFVGAFFALYRGIQTFQEVSQMLGGDGIVRPFVRRKNRQ